MLSLDDEKFFQELEGRALEALGHDDDWWDLFQALSDCLQSSTVSLHTFSIDGLPLDAVFSHHSEIDMHTLDYDTMAISPRYRAAPRLLKRPCDVITDRDMLSPEAASRDIWYNECAVDIRAYNWIGGRIPTVSRNHYVISSQSGSSWRDPTDDEILTMSRIMSAMSAPLSLSERLSGASATTAMGLIDHHRACALISRDAGLVRTNAKFERLLRSGAVIQSVNNRLSFHNPTHDTFLRSVLDKRMFPPASFFVGSDQMPGRYRVSILPVPRSGFGPSHVVASLFFDDCEDPPSLDLKWVTERYGFTRAETAVAKLLCDGLSTEAICSARGVSASTFRSQILSLLKKTECGTRAELVSTLMRFQTLTLNR